MASANYQTKLIIKADGSGGIKVVEQFNDKLSNTSKKAKTAKVSVSDLAQGVQKYTTIVTAAATAGTAFIAYNANAIKQQNNLAQALGYTAEELSSISYVMRNTGLDAAKVGDIFADMTEKVGEAISEQSGEALEALDLLNINAQAFADMNAEQKMYALADALEGINDQATRVSIMEKLGNDAKLMLPELSKGVDSLKSAQEEARILGVTLSEFDTSQIAQASSDMGRLGSAISGAGNIITAEFAPGLGAISAGLVDAIKQSGGLENAIDGWGDAVTDSVALILRGVDNVESGFINAQISFLEMRKEFFEFYYKAEKWNPLASDEQVEAAKKNYIEAFNELGEAQNLLYDIRQNGREAQFKASVALTKREYELEAQYQQDLIALGFDENDVHKTSTVQIAKGNDKLKERLEIAEGISSELSVQAQMLAAQVDGFGVDKAAEAAEWMRQTLQWRKDIHDLGFADEIEAEAKAIEKVAEQANPFADAWENAFDRMDNSAADMFRNFEFTAESAFDIVENSFKQMLAEMAYSATIQPLIVGVQGVITGNGVGGSSNLFGSIANAYNQYDTLSNLGYLSGLASYGASALGLSASGSQAAMLYSQTADFGLAGANLTAQSGSFAGNLSAGAPYLSAIGGALYGYEQKGAAGALTGAAGGYAGAQAGAAIGSLAGPVGTAVGAVLGGIVGAIGGGSVLGTDWSTKDYGTRIEAGVMGVDADYYNYQTKKKSLWRGTKRKTTYDDAPEIEAAIGSMITGMLSTLDANANALGLDLADTLTFTVKESFKGLDDAEIAAKIQEMTTSIYIDAAESIDGLDELVAPFALAGEQSADTLSRLITQFSIIDGTLESLGANLGDLSINGVDAAQNILNLVGGLDAFAVASQSYYQNFYSAEEQFADLTEDLTAQLAAVNLQLPQTKAGYRALLESLDDGTEIQQAQIATLLRLNGVASDYFATIEQGTLAMSAAASAFSQSLVLSAVSSVAQQSTVSDAIANLESQLTSSTGTSGGGSSSDDMATLLREQLSELQGIESALESARLSIYEAVLQSDNRGFDVGMAMLREIQAGTRDAAQIDQALGFIGNLSTSQFATRQDYLSAQASAYALVRDLETQYEDQIDPVQAQLDELEAIASASASSSASGAIAAVLLEDQLTVLKSVEDLLQSGATINESIMRSLDDQYDLLDSNADKQISLQEFQAMFEPIADRATLQRLFEITDLNGDGIIDELEAINASLFTAKDEWIAELLPIIQNISTGQLTKEQVVFALDGLATERQAIALFNALDTDNNGIITELEAQSGLFADFSPMLGEILGENFADLDQTLDGLIDWPEFHSAFDGLATDATLMAGFQSLDLNLDGLISKVESANAPLAASVESAYNTVLNKASDTEGQAFWSDAVETGVIKESQLNEEIANVANDMGALDVSSYVESVYQSLLGRSADAGGLEFWSNAISDGVITPSQLDDEMAKAAGITIPAFASGGLHSGGIRLVGEQGPELEFTGPSRIVNNSDTMRMFDNSETNQLLKQVITKLDDVAKRIDDGEMAQASKSMSNLMSNWDLSGMPASKTINTSGF